MNIGKIVSFGNVFGTRGRPRKCEGDISSRFGACSRLVSLGILFLLGTICQANLWVFVTEVDFTGNYPATDRVWFYSNPNGTPQNPPLGGGQYPTLEQHYVSGAVSTDRIVYRRGSTISLGRRFHNTNLTAVTATLTMDYARLEVPAGYNGRVAQTLNLTPASNTVVSIAGNSSVDVTVTITGVPNFVAYGWLNYESHLYALSGAPFGTDLIADPIGSTGLETYRLYLTDEAPVELQTIPWTDVLEYSCDFGYGKSGVAYVAKEEAFGWYWSAEVAYNLGTETVPSNYVWIDEAAETQEVRLVLRDYLDDFSSLEYIDVNCVDVAAFVQALFSSQGVTSDLHMLKRPNGLPWVTNLFVPIGSDASDDALYVHTEFYMHTQAIRGNLVYDSALGYRFDLNGAIYKNPAAAWAMPGYWQTLIGNSSFGHVYRWKEPTDIFDTHVEYLWKVVIPDSSIPPGPTSMAPPCVFDVNSYKHTMEGAY